MAKSKCSKKDATSKKKRQRSPPPSPVLTPRKAKGNAIDKLADRAVQDKQRPAWLSLSPVAYTAYAIRQQARLKGVGPRLKTFDDKGFRAAHDWKGNEDARNDDHLFVKKMMKIGTKKRQGNNNRAHVPPISTNFVTHDNSSSLLRMPALHEYCASIHVTARARADDPRRKLQLPSSQGRSSSSLFVLASDVDGTLAPCSSSCAESSPDPSPTKRGRGSTSSAREKSGKDRKNDRAASLRDVALDSARHRHHTKSGRGTDRGLNTSRPTPAARRQRRCQSSSV